MDVPVEFGRARSRQVRLADIELSDGEGDEIAKMNLARRAAAAGSAASTRIAAEREAAAERKASALRARSALTTGQIKRARGRLDLEDDYSTHWSEKTRAEMQPRDWAIFMEDFRIQVAPRGAMLPARSWAESGLPERLIAMCVKAHPEPSPAQMAGVVAILTGRDTILTAETGSGKTLAYALPILAAVLKRTRRPPADAARLGPVALVVVPARELARQAAGAVERFGEAAAVRVATVYGGVEGQATALRSGPEVVVGTPGRLVEFLERRELVLNACAMVVVDEADRIIDEGLASHIAAIFDAAGVPRALPPEEATAASAAAAADTRAAPAAAAGAAPAAAGGGVSADGAPAGPRPQVVMVSATMPLACEKIVASYCDASAVLRVRVGIGLSGTVGAAITQEVEWVTDPKTRMAKLLVRIRRALPQPSIVFCNERAGVDEVAAILQREGLAVAALHGSKQQEVRDSLIDGFRSGRFVVLVGTDLVGRGIDIPHVGLVVNYDMPRGTEAIATYTHRIGRTGRAGMSGTAVSFVAPTDTDIIPALRAKLEADGQRVPRELAMADAAAEKGAPVKRRKQDVVIYAQKTLHD